MTSAWTLDLDWYLALGLYTIPIVLSLGYLEAYIRSVRVAMNCSTAARSVISRRLQFLLRVSENLCSPVGRLWMLSGTNVIQKSCCQAVSCYLETALI